MQQQTWFARSHPRALAIILALTLSAMIVPVGLAASHQAGGARRAGAPPRALSPAHAASPLLFVQNEGQWPAAVRFQADTSAGVLWVTDSGLWLSALQGPAPTRRAAPRAPAPRSAQRSARGVSIRLSFPGASTPSIQPLDRQASRISYLFGNLRTRWHADVPVWAGVRLANLYPGVDLVLGGTAGQLQPRIEARAGANISAVSVSVDGARSVATHDGALLLSTAIGQVRLPLFQLSGASVAPRVQGNDVLHPFANGPVADTAVGVSPVTFSTYLGGGTEDHAYAVARDNNGNVYVTGLTFSPDFPTTTGAFQGSCKSASVGCNTAFVSELDPTGSTLIYSTFLGGSSGDLGDAIAVDSSGHAFVAGVTYSTDFPVVSSASGGAFQTTCGSATSSFGCNSGFVTELDKGGATALYSTYLGGNTGDSDYGIVVDGGGDAYVTGVTLSTNYPVASSATPFQKTCQSASSSNGCESAFVSKLNPTGSALLYSTYLGGGNATDGYAITLDSAGNAAISGYTAASDFPTKQAYQSACPSANGAVCNSAFVSTVNATGSGLVHSTFLGGSGGDAALGLAADGSGNLYVTGVTTSTNFPVSSGAAQSQCASVSSSYGCNSAFVTALNTAGGSTALVWSTYLGGGNGEAANSVAVDAAGNVYVTGVTYSTDFPVTANAQQAACAATSCQSAFVSELHGGGLVNSTYFGGSGHDASYGVAVGGVGDVVIAGHTTSRDFPISASAFQASCQSAGSSGGCSSAFVSEVYLVQGSIQPASLAVSNASIGASGVTYTLSGTLSTTVTVGSLVYTLPAGASASNPAIVSRSGLGAGALSTSGNVITDTLTSAATIGAGASFMQQISGIVNPPTAGAASVNIAMRDGAGLLVATGTTNSVTFGSPTPTPTPTPTGTPTPGPSSSRAYWFTWYDSESGADSLLVSNPIENGRSAYVHVIIGGGAGPAVDQNYTIAPGQEISETYSNVKTGPVQVISTNNLPLVSSQRILINGSFEEVLATPDSQLTDTYYYTWYDATIADNHDWILLYNPNSASETVQVTVAGHVYFRETLAAQQVLFPFFAGIKNGPVIVQAYAAGTNAPMRVLTSQRVLTTEFNEVWGIPANNLGKSYIYTWYDAIGTQDQDWILVGNPSTTITVTWSITVGVGAGSVAVTGLTAPGGVTYVNRPLAGVRNGPVRVEASAPVFTSQRSLWGGFGGSFEEEPGVRTDQLSPISYFTYYDSTVTQGDWILVANPNSYGVAATIIYNGFAYQVAIGPNGHYYQQLPGLGGPVEVTGVKDGATIPAPLLTSQRTLWQNGSDFNEVLGIAYPQ